MIEAVVLTQHVVGSDVTGRSPGGGMGRRKGLKIPWEEIPVWVRIPPRACVCKDLHEGHAVPSDALNPDCPPVVPLDAPAVWAASLATPARRSASFTMS